MKSLKIEFGEDGARILFDQEVEGFDTSIQNGLVNFGTARGSDDIFPTDRGTNLLQQAAGGLLIDQQTSMHEANFAAIDTVFFVRDTGPADLEEKLEEIRTQTTFFNGERLTIETIFRSDLGNEVGVFTTLNNG